MQPGSVMAVTVGYREISVGETRLPCLETERLSLRPLLEHDVARILIRAPKPHEPEVVGTVPDAAALAELREHAYATWRRDGLGPLMIVQRADDSVVGQIELQPIDRDGGRRGAEITYAVDPPYQRRGYAVEAAAAIAVFAFEVAGVDPLVAFIGLANAASLGVAARLGFDHVGQTVVRGKAMQRMLLTVAKWRSAPAATLAPR